MIRVSAYGLGGREFESWPGHTKDLKIELAWHSAYKGQIKENTTETLTAAC